jgi:hypothetical protein
MGIKEVERNRSARSYGNRSKSRAGKAVLFNSDGTMPKVHVALKRGKLRNAKCTAPRRDENANDYEYRSSLKLNLRRRGRKIGVN